MNYVALLIFFVSSVILSVFVSAIFIAEEMNNKVGYAISEIVELKSKCEANLTRNKQCVLVFEVENE